MAEVKIVYCKGDNEKEVFYADCKKKEKYYCIECGDELVLKDGNLKIKHLAHKSNIDCKGNGETVFHKHWKESTFQKGLTINYKNHLCEILHVHTEVSLKTRYKTNWERDIVVDVLLETTHGDIIVEVYYSNNKDWLELEKYYNSIESRYLAAFEVKISNAINKPTVWMDKDDILATLKEKAEKKLNRELKNSAKKRKLHEQNTALRYLDCYFNPNTTISKIDSQFYAITCAVGYKNWSKEYVYAPVALKFDLSKQFISLERLKRNFSLKSGIYKSVFTVRGTVNVSEWLNVESFYDLKPTDKYDKYLYTLICESTSIMPKFSFNT